MVPPVPNRFGEVMDENVGTVAGMLNAFFARIGESDCESIASGAFAQPVNAVSSLTYSIVGAAIVVWAFRVEGQERVVRIAFGVLMAATGAGSVMFHGPQGQGSQFVHDVTFLLAVLFLGVLNASSALSLTSGVSWSLFGGGSVVLAGILLLSPGVTNILMVVVVMGLIGSDIVLHRRVPRGGWWYLASLGAMVVAIAMFLLGRTGGLLCDPDSVFQGHGLWHLLSAGALGSYFIGTTRSRFHTPTEVST